MKKTALVLIILTSLSKLIGFGREVILSYYYGASAISDAYIISMTIPIIMFSFIAKGISTGYIPMYSKINDHYGKTEANDYTNNLINVLLCVCVIFIVLGIVFTAPIVKVFASGFEGETFNLAVQLTRISFLSLFFTVLTSVFVPYLQIEGSFIVPGLIGLPMNIVIILSIIISSKGNITVLGYGIVFANLAQFLFLYPYVMKKGLKYKAKINLADPHIKSMVYLALPVILGVSVNDINKLVDRTLASQIIEGGISALNYAQRLTGFVYAIVVTSIATAIYPTLSKMASKKDYESLKKVLIEAINAIQLLVIPMMVGIIFLSEPMVGLLFGRGAFSQEAIILTSTALFFYSFGMLGMALREIASRPFYSMQDTKTPMINATIGMILNIVLNILLSRYIGIAGLALATSISASVTSLLLFKSLRTKIGRLGLKKTIKPFMKIVSTSTIMGFCSRLAFDYFVNVTTNNISLLLSVFVGIIIYGAGLYLFKVEEYLNLIALLKNSLFLKNNKK